MEESLTALYKNSREHLADELEKLDTLLSLQVLRFRESHSRTDGDAFAPCYIGEEDVDRILKRPPAGNKKNDSPSSHTPIQTLRNKISERVKNSANNGVYLPLLKLSRLFQLSPFEMDVVLICLALELDPKYEKLYAYLQDDITKKIPSVCLILDLLCSTGEERLDARTYFFDHAPLLKYRLITFTADSRERPLLARGLKPDDRVVNFLLEQDGIGNGLASTGELIAPARDWSCLLMENDLIQRLKRLQEAFFNGNRGSSLVFYLEGPYGAGKKSLAEAFCFQLKLPLFVIDISELPAGDSQTGIEETVDRLFREAPLQSAAVYLEHFDILMPGNAREPQEIRTRNAVVRAIEEFSFITFLAGETPWDPPPRLKRHPVVKIEVPIPSFRSRKQLWELSLNSGCPLSPDVDIDALAGKFKFTGGQIQGAAAQAKHSAVMRGTFHNPGLTMADLYLGCHAQTNHNLSRMARKIIPHYSWSDIVLPADKFQQLREMCNYVKYRHTVYGEWGFDKKISLGKGLNILFSGPSGTGKTMAAEIISNELNLDFYKIDLSCVVSKYIGETEKNLSAIFKEAETANAVLFFDEADALFGKRSEVKDSHDRYANIEINYLLQKMEEHEGIVILATNFRKNIDDAFTRRIHFSLDFPFPDETYRIDIWRKIFPPQTPKSSDIDFDYLAGRFKISGGSIKNIALNAAFLAADNSKKVGMSHIIHATRREFQKTGQVYDRSDFHEYDGSAAGRAGGNHA